MDLGYLNLQPEVENRYDVTLEEGEKVVFAAKLSLLGTEKDSNIGSDCDFTLTNRRMIIDNHAGVWSVEIADNISGFKKVKGGFLMFKYAYLEVLIKETIVFDNGNQKLNGFHLYFNEADMARMEEIMSNLLR